MASRILSLRIVAGCRTFCAAIAATPPRPLHTGAISYSCGASILVPDSSISVEEEESRAGRRRDGVLMRGETHMPRFVEMDDRTTLVTQLEQEFGTVVLINEFTVEPEDEEQFLKAWAADAAVMKRQPGFISTQLHKGVGGSRVFVNYAVWE